MKRDEQKKERGITLIALVVTIVVLLILAGVTITMILGEDGIIEAAREAAEKTNVAIKDEQQMLQNMADVANEYINGNGGIGSGSGSTNTETPPPAQSEGISLETIKEKATEFYGKTVNYTSTNSTGVTKWRIFYAGKIDDGDGSEQGHIYLIADDYISKDNAPEKDGQKLTGDDGAYNLYFSDELLNCYSSGASGIYNNQKVRNLLKQYFDYSPDSYPNRESTNNNIKAVAYMLDTEIWSAKYGDGGKNAEYAIGGPTLEMFVKSYNETHSENSISCEVTGKNGYTFSTGDGLTSDYDNIYRIPEDAAVKRNVACGS